MMSGVPGPPPGGGNQIHLQSNVPSGMLDMKTEPKIEVNYKPLNPNGTIHDDVPNQIKSENIQPQPHTIPHQTATRPIQPAIRPVQRVLLSQGQPIRQVHPVNIPSSTSNSLPAALSGAQPILRTTSPSNATLAPSGGATAASAGGNPNLSPEDQSTVLKCKNFLMTLIQLAQRNEQANPQTVHNVKELVQQLIDDSITAESFTERLQTELQSSPQPYLVPFLRKSLPLLRRSMQTPNQTPNPSNTQLQPTRTVPTPRPQMVPPTTPRPGQPTSRIMVRPVSRTPVRTEPTVPRIRLPPAGVPINPRPANRVRPAHPGRISGQPPNKIASVERGGNDEDDITDVTAMADVDLTYESKVISTSADIGTEIRGAPGGDKATSVNESVLHKLVGQAASRSGGIDRVTPDGARLIGLALEEHIKSLVSKAIHAASHRTIQFKESDHREKITDVKNQFKYLHELMVIERTQAEEAEQEQRAKLLRSRNKKDEDPDREKRKKDAKLKQQALQEAEQQKQADSTALEASRRRPKSSAPASSSIQSGSSTRTTRICRVKIRDVLFCLESEKLDRNSRDEMFKRYLK